MFWQTKHAITRERSERTLKKMGEISRLASQNRQQGNQLFLSLDNKVYTKRAADKRLAVAYSRVCARFIYLMSVGIRQKPEFEQSMTLAINRQSYRT